MLAPDTWNDDAAIASAKLASSSIQQSDKLSDQARTDLAISLSVMDARTRRRSVPLITLCAEGRILSLNDMAVALTGFSADDCVGHGLELFHADGSDECSSHRALLRNAAQRGMAEGALVIVHRQGSRLEVKASFSALRNRGEVPYGFAYVARPRFPDMLPTLSSATESKLREDNEVRRITLAFIADGVITTDQAGMITYLNPAAEGMTGWNAMEAIGRSRLEVFNVMEDKHPESMVDSSIPPTIDGIEYQSADYDVMISRNGEERDINQSVAAIHGVDGKTVGAVIVFRDITSYRQTEKQLRHQATHDPLTGLANRYEFERRSACLMEQSQPLDSHAILYLDLDQFKIVNDTCGHVAGDELLRQLSTVLATKVRQSDTLARLGGDEFGVLLDGCSVGDARRIAHQILWAIDAFVFDWEKRKFKLTASIGVAPLLAGQSIATALSDADGACYIAKEQGRNRIHVYQENDRSIGRHRRQMEWVPRLQEAVANNSFQLYLQPIIPLGQHSDTSTRHFEVLLRLIDEQGRIILPGAFIPAAERYFQMDAIDRWVLRTALAKLGELFPDEDCNFALNLSGQTIGQENFLHYALEEIDASGVDPRNLCFEITETAAIGNLDLAVRMISVLRQRGVQFALDDFGVGISSLSYLKNLRVDYLKIDGSFVRGMAKDPMDRALVTAIQQAGQIIGIKTIAESIEDAETMEILQSLGVNYGQGYYIGRPKPIEEYQRGFVQVLRPDSTLEAL